MTHHFQLNSRFNRIGGNLPLAELGGGEEDFFSIVKRQGNLIAEEFKEFCDGIGKRDIDEIRDGLGDVVVTVDGLFYRLGLEYPDTSTWHQFPGSIENALNHAEEALRSLIEIGDREVDLSHSELLTILKYNGTGILLSMYQIAEKYGIDLQADQEAIVASNMSKFDTDKVVAVLGLDKYANIGVKAELVPIENDGVIYHVIRCTESAIGSDGKQYKVGKILKSINFKEPQFSPLPADAPLNSLFT